MVWDWRVSRVEPIPSCWHDLLFLFCLLLFYLLPPSMVWLCVVWVFGLIECSHSLPSLHSGLQIIIIIIIKCLKTLHELIRCQNGGEIKKLMVNASQKRYFIAQMVKNRIKTKGHEGSFKVIKKVATKTSFHSINVKTLFQL